LDFVAETVSISMPSCHATSTAAAQGDGVRATHPHVIVAGTLAITQSVIEGTLLEPDGWKIVARQAGTSST
jgi:hypothetical protein